jgi:hypothetical protein
MGEGESNAERVGEQIGSLIDIGKETLFPIRSEPALKEEKTKKRKVRQYITDFSEFLPEALININRTILPARIRVGARYQADVPACPTLKSSYRPM